MAIAMIAGAWFSVLGSPLSPLRAQESHDPTEIWYRGHLLVLAANEFEENQNYLAALNNLSEAEPIYLHLSQVFPDYQPLIVRERRRLIAAKRDELKQLMRAPAPSAPAALALPSGPSPNQFTSPPVSSPPTHPAGGGGGVSSPPPAAGYGSQQRIMEVEPVDREFSLPTWDEGASQPLPRVAGGIDGVPRVETRQPSVGAIASSLHSELANKDQLINWLNQENQRLREQVGDRESMLKRAQDDLALAQANVKTLRHQQADAMARGGAERVEELKSLLRNATEQLQQSVDTNATLVAELRDSRDEVKKLRSRMVELERERDNLVEVVRGEGNGGKALRELMERNRTLTEQLDRAERLAMSLSELNKEKDQDIAMLKSEINRVKLERDQLLAENARHQQSIDQLQRKLQMLSDGLTAEEQNAMAAVSPIERQENELLRSMVLKQLRRQAQVKQAKELLIRQLGKVGERSDALLSLVEDMTRGTQLTEEERALFRAPQIQELIEAATGERVRAGAATVVLSPLNGIASGRSKEKDGEDGKDEAPPLGSEDGPALAEGGGGESGESGESGSPPVRSGASMSATLVAAGSASGPPTDGFIPSKKVSVELAQLDKAARLDFLEGRFSEAEDGFLEYLRLRPRSVSCLCNLGVLKLAMRNFTEAEYYLERALAIDDESGLAHYLLGRTYFLQGRLDEALERLETGVAHDPQNAKAHNCIGVISSQKGWLVRAESAFTNAVSIDPKYGDAHFNLAVLYATRDDPDPKAAEKHYFEALHLGIPRDATIEEFLEAAAADGTSIGMR